MKAPLRVLSALLLALSSGTASAAPAQGAVPLFRPLPATPPALAKAAAPALARQFQRVALDVGALGTRGLPSPGDVASRLDLNLFADARFTAEKVSLDWSGPGRFTWSGRVVGDPSSSVLLVAREGRLTGTLTAGDRVFEILPEKGGGHLVTELDPAAVEATEQAETDQVMGPIMEMAPPAADTGSDLLEIDVMVLYEKPVADRVADMEAFIASLIAASNEAYVRSKVPQRLRLVHTGLITPGQGGSAALSWLGRDPGVAQLRNQHGADLVSLLLESSLSACGVGNINGAFTIVKRSCALGNRSFAHELGHNMGAMHDRDQFENPSGFNYGYINRTKNWRTIMSYATGCSCPRINNFSNPDVLHNGDPTGVANSMDNARMLRQKSASIAAFRRPAAPSGPSLAVDKAGQGKVVSDVAGIQCGTDCTETFAAGTSRIVTLTALPDPGWVFKGWEGPCTGTGTCRLTVDSARRVLARFENPDFLTLVLADAGKDVEIRTVKDSLSIRLDSLPTQLAVVAKAAGTVGSIAFAMEGAAEREQVESIAPFALFSDASGDLYPWNPAPRAGTYRIRVTAYSQASGAGEELGDKEFVLVLRAAPLTGIAARGLRAGEALRVTRAGVEVDLAAPDYLRIRRVTPEGRVLAQSAGRFPAGRTTVAMALPGNTGLHLVEVRGERSGVMRKVVAPE